MADNSRDNLRDIYVANTDFGKHKKGEKFSTGHQNTEIFYMQHIPEESTPTEYVATPMRLGLDKSEKVTFVETVTLEKLAEMVASGDVVQ